MREISMVAGWMEATLLKPVYDRRLGKYMYIVPCFESAGRRLRLDGKKHPIESRHIDMERQRRAASGNVWSSPNRPSAFSMLRPIF